MLHKLHRAVGFIAEYLINDELFFGSVPEKIRSDSERLYRLFSLVVAKVSAVCRKSHVEMGCNLLIQ